MYMWSLLGSRNCTNKVPAGLVGLAKLRYLDLSYNALLGGVFPELIGKFVSLEVLALNYNKLNRGLTGAGTNFTAYSKSTKIEVDIHIHNHHISLHIFQLLKILETCDN